jgi:lipopolysaccharide biosynthesis regulator YciM
MEQRRYADAASLLESAVKANPSNAYAHMMLGTVRLRSHNTDQALDAFHKALEIDSGALLLNNVAYELAEGGTNLPEALGYSQRSVKEVEERSQKVDIEKIQKVDLQLSAMIGAYWDTLGWIYFKVGDLARAESYLNSAWQLTQDGLVGDHLGQVYEKEQKLPAALHMYNLALEANPRLADTASRMRNLAHVRLPKNRMSAAEELTLMRTIKLPTITKGTAAADFDVIVASGKRKGEFFPGARNASPCWREPTREGLVGRAVSPKLDGTPAQKRLSFLFLQQLQFRVLSAFGSSNPASAICPEPVGYTIYVNRNNICVGAD